MKNIYRLLSPCAGLGYGFPEESFREAMKSRIDLIGVDCGSMDPGPYYLGSGKSYEKKENLKRNFSLLLQGALEQNCPLMLGSCGMAGDTPNLDFMLAIAKEVFEELNLCKVKVAVVSSHLAPELIVSYIHDLIPLGRMPSLTKDDISSCKIVAQMGIAPYMKALDEGAQVIFAGRSCDVAIFAAGPVRHGIDAGLAYHAGHILECGAVACDPGSASDCLMAEFGDDGSVTFTPPNKKRKATTYSIAAHTLYEEDHPTVQFYPEGVLSFSETEYFSTAERSASIRNSAFAPKPLTMKIEGSKKIGERYVSLIACKDIRNIPSQYIVYGRNGVESEPVSETENEIGLLIKVKGATQEAVEGLFTLWKGLLLHSGYPGRRATAGNLAFPMSPSEINYRDSSGNYVCFLITGTRDPYFQENLELIMEGAQRHVEQEYPILSKKGKIEITVASKSEAIMYLETLGITKEEALIKHQEDLARIERFIDRERTSELAIYADEFYEWGIYHIFKNSEVIRQQMFPISIYNCDGNRWKLEREVRPTYETGAIDQGELSIDYTKLSAVTPVHHKNPPRNHRLLPDIARIIRSKNAGINKLTYDIFFNTKDDYAIALDSNVFLIEHIAQMLAIPAEQIIGTYRADACYAIKISVNRSLVSGSVGDRDVFGAQQHARLLKLAVPVF